MLGQMELVTLLKCSVFAGTYVRSSQYMCVCMLGYVFISMNLNIPHIISPGQGHYDMNQGMRSI